MNVLSPIRFGSLILLLPVFACQEISRRQQADTPSQIFYSYSPEYATLRITSDINNPEITGIRLLNDKRTDSLATAEAKNGNFILDVDNLPLHEVYFLEIKGRSARKGTSGLNWTEHVPIYFEEHAKPSLQQRFFDHPGSISKASFFISGGSQEQEALNNWQKALTNRQAEIEGKMSHYTLSISGATKVSDKDDHTENDEGNITQQHLQEKKPLVASLFFTYISNDHRAYFSDYLNLYMSLPPESQQTKYGVDLIQRLDRIRAPIERLDPATQIAAVDPLLTPINWDNFHAYRYLLLSFWDNENKASHEAIKQLEAQSTQFEQWGTALIHLSVNRRFSRWKSTSTSMNLKHNYKLRNQVQQPLIDFLYMTTLPRYVLIQPTGEVIDADVPLDKLHEFINPSE